MASTITLQLTVLEGTDSQVNLRDWLAKWSLAVQVGSCIHTAVVTAVDEDWAAAGMAVLCHYTCGL